MRLQGLHHVTMLTADARENLRFGAEVLGLRFVKKTIHFDFGQYYPDNGEAQFHTRIISNPVYTKALVQLLGKSIEQYEQTFGRSGSKVTLCL